MTELNGVLPVDKPAGPTSHDVVSRARRMLGVRRIGHTGTLDPFASGLLLLCIGPATRLAEYLTALPKSYRAVLRLGQATDTDDRMGAVVQESEAWRALESGAVEAALGSQVGDILQLPPAYSAKKVDGERMYAAARRGEVVQRTPVPVTVHSLRLLRLELPEVEFEVECSSGTYIRAIARDVGEALGVGGHLVELRRTRIGDHGVESALSLDQLENPAAVRERLLAPADALIHLPSVRVDDEGARALAHGRSIEAPAELEEGRRAALLSPSGALLAIGERVADRVQPRKVFA